VDFSEFAGGIQNHRFDGWTDTAIAEQITRVINGDGTGSIGTAVDALKAVALALAQTDQTLRDEMQKLGVEWQSTAGGAAGQVMTRQAGFSQDANVKVTHAAEMVFAQGEAFNRTKYKLPDAETVRKGAGGYTVTDGLLSLIGFETDHAKQVAAADEARGQAVQALNEYAQESGTNLLSTQTLSDPEKLKVSTGSGTGAVDLAGSAVAVTPDGGVRPASDHVRSQHVDPPVAQPVVHKTTHVDPPTPVYGVPAPAPSKQTGVAPPSHNTAPASTSPAGVKPQPTPPGGWMNPPARGPIAAGPGPFAPGQFGGNPADGFVPPGAPGGQTGSTSTQPIKSLGGGSSPGAVGVDGAAGSGGTRGADGLLAKGRTVGAGPQSPLQPGSFTGERGFAMKPGASPGELGAGAAAVGAGAAGGALSGEKDRQRRTPSGQKGPVRPLPVGELPEEEAAALRKSEQISPKQSRGETKFLSEAAPQETDAEHVRRYGVDDKDLFADQRMVSNDVIGDEARDVH
jgi:hypothetical protein